MRRLLVLRPEPGAGETVARAEALGWRALAVPLFETRALPWPPPSPDAFDAVMLTSAATLRHGGAQLAAYHALPALAVGEATAEAARAAGFADIREGARDADALLALARDAGLRRLLHLAGREHRAATLAGLEVTRVSVYAADQVDDAGKVLAALDPVDVALVHSPRAARRLAALAAPAWRGRTRLAAISPAAAEEAGPGWAGIAIAGRPTDAALLAAAATLCDQAACGE